MVLHRLRPGLEQCNRRDDCLSQTAPVHEHNVIHTANVCQLAVLCQSRCSGGMVRSILPILPVSSFQYSPVKAAYPKVGLLPGAVV